MKKLQTSALLALITVFFLVCVAIAQVSSPGLGQFVFDVLSNLKVNVQSCSSGESICIPTSPNSYLMVAPSVPRTTVAITGVTTNTTSATFTLPAGAKTLSGKVEGTGAVTQTQVLNCHYDSTAANPVVLATVTLSGTTKDVKNGDVQVTKDCPFYSVTTSNTTGTGATGELIVANGLVASSTGGGGGGDASAANQTTMIGHLNTFDNIVGVEDAAETAGGGLSMTGSVRRDVAASSAGTTGDNATVNTDALGSVWTRFIDPCTGLAKTHIAVSISTATTTEVTAALAGASTHYYVCQLNLVTAGANNVALVDDDSDNCASVTSGLAGGTTAASGWNFPANGGIVVGHGLGTVFKTAGTNRVLCLVTSAAVQLSGSLEVVTAP